MVGPKTEERETDILKYILKIESTGLGNGIDMEDK